MKNIQSCDLEAMHTGGVTSNPASDVLFALVAVKLVANGHDVKREKLAFWLFQNYVKSDLMSHNMKMSDMCN